MNKNVVYTVITGGYDKLRKHFDVDGYDFICFTDNENLKSDFWEIRYIPDELKELSDSKKNRCIKILPHKYLPEYDFSIYIDGNIDIKGDINEYVRNNCTPDNGYIFIGKHPYGRNCIYDEAIALVDLKKDKKETMFEQVEGYKKEGFPKNYGLTQNSIIFRYHNNSECIKLMECWWNEVKK